MEVGIECPLGLWAGQVADSLARPTQDLREAQPGVEFWEFWQLRHSLLPRGQAWGSRVPPGVPPPRRPPGLPSFLPPLVQEHLAATQPTAAPSSQAPHPVSSAGQGRAAPNPGLRWQLGAAGSDMRPPSPEGLSFPFPNPAPSWRSRGLQGGGAPRGGSPLCVYKHPPPRHQKGGSGTQNRMVAFKFQIGPGAESKGVWV